MSHTRHAVILAAGRGQRMMPLTTDLPKPMAPYNGSTLIAQGISQIRSHIENVHITVGYKKAMLAQHVIEKGAASVLCTEGRGNAWWLFNTLLKNLDEPLYVLTCDNLLDLDFDVLEQDYTRLGQPACMLVGVEPVPGLEGDYIFREGNVVTALDRRRPSEIYCSGVQVLNPAEVNRTLPPSDDFYDVWAGLIAMRRLMVSSVYPKRWFSVDTVEQLAQAEKARR